MHLLAALPALEMISGVGILLWQVFAWVIVAQLLAYSLYLLRMRGSEGGCACFGKKGDAGKGLIRNALMASSAVLVAAFVNSPSQWVGPRFLDHRTAAISLGFMLAAVYWHSLGRAIEWLETFALVRHDSRLARSMLADGQN